MDNSRTIRELIDGKAQEQGETTFLFSPETGRVLTFAGLQKQSRSISALLRQLGLKRDDKVAFLLENGLFTVQLFLGTMYAGLVSVPLNVRAGISQLAYTLDHSDAKVVFVEDQYAALAREAIAGVGRTVQIITADVDAFAMHAGEAVDDMLHAPPAGEDVAMLMYTSGSVGVPKAAIHSHRTVLAHGHNSVSSHQLTSADRSLLVLPLYHINAECVTLIPTLLSGGSIVVPHHFNVSQFWGWLEEYRCTWSAIVPTIVSQLLDWKDPDADRRGAVLQRIRFLRSSSAPLSPSLQREFIGKFNLRLIQAMGSSEAGNIFSNPQQPAQNKIGTPGLAWGFETRIIAPNGEDVASGEPGEILIRGAAVMHGYYKDADGTAAVLDTEGWLHTGDLAYRDQDGYFFVIGRSKELIIKGGMNIAPRQIDEVLESHPAVLEAAVVGVPDHYLGEDLVAFTVLRTGMEVDEREMLAFCENRLGHFKTPTRIHFVADLPKGPSGKVQRMRLLNEVGQPAATMEQAHSNAVSANCVLPATSPMIQHTISQGWSEVLEQPIVDPNTNFFSLGGHSLMAIECLSRMRDKLPIALSLSDFFENPTVAQQVALVSQRLNAIDRNGGQASPERFSLAWERTRSGPTSVPTGPQPIAARGKNLPYRLSSGQQRIWFFKELAPEVPLYNECEAVRLVGELKTEVLEQALNLIIARHEVLRTTIQMAAERPIAIVRENFLLRMKQIDLGSLDPTHREAELQRLLIDEPRRSYNLEAEPGIRATLLRLGSREHVFILMMHHLVCDWASEGTLWRELSSAYRALSHGEQVALSSLSIQFGDYAVWQQQRVDEETFAEDLAFWGENLRGAPELLDLPSDRPRPSVQSYRGARQRFQLNGTLTEALRDCSRKEKTSLFTVFAAAFNTLLYRYTGSEDILIGIPLADRDRQELRSMIGFLLHTHVLRTQLSAGTSFRELLARVQKGLVALYTHREVPFDQVVSKLRPDRSLSHTPLFQVMINWRDREQLLSFIGLDGLVVESLLAETQTAKFDLTLMLTDNGEEISLEAEYNTDLFDYDRIARMFGHYQVMLEAIATRPDLRLSELPMMTNAEHRLLEKWNATRVPYPEESCIYQLFELQAEKSPDAVAVVFGNDQITYQELNKRSNQLAHYLRKLGVKADELVGICVERSIDMMVGMLGILKAGGAYVPLDPAYPQERLSFMLRDSRAALLVTQRKLRQSLSGDCRILCLDEDWQRIENEENSNPDCDGYGDNLAYVIYTSGSTGRPKGVRITHRSLVNLLCSMRRKPGLTDKDILAAVTTLSFDIAALELLLPLSVGAKVVIVSREIASDGMLLLELLVGSGVTVIQATPITFRILIEAGWSSMPTMKVLCGGEALPRDLADQILARGHALWNMYGPTETTIWSSTIQVHAGDDLVSIGGPIDNTQFYVLDAAEMPAPIGVTGELLIGGVGLARGYLDQPKLTAEKFIPYALNSDRSVRLYRTGDLVRWRADGSIDFLGRTDSQVKLRGFRIELGEIEAALKQHPGVSQCVVITRERQAADKQLMAYIVSSDPNGNLALSELRETLKQKLPDYMVPVAFMKLDKLPLTPNGKIDRKALPAAELDRASSVADYVAPRTPIEETLAEIWRKVLGLTQVGIHDDFFALGGYSLLAMRLVGEVRKLLKDNFSVAAFFQDPTIERMARVLQVTEKVEVEERQKEFRVVLRQGVRTLASIPENARSVLLQSAEGQPPFFIVESLPYFIDVVKMLGTDRPVISLISQEAIQSSSSYDIAGEASAHVKTILEYQRQGPFMVGGFSASGIVAYEIARQLQESGHMVGLIALLDVVNPQFTREYSAMSRSLAYNKAALKRLRWGEVPRWILAKLVDLITKRRLNESADPSRGEKKNPTTYDVESLPEFGLTAIRIAAARKYRPRPYNGKLLLIKRHRDLGGRYLDPRLGWGDAVSGKIEVGQVTANEHRDILKSEFDRALVAQKLRSAFDEVAANFLTDDVETTFKSERRVG